MSQIETDDIPKIGFFYRNKARLIALILIGLISTLIYLIVINFLTFKTCKKKQIEIIIMIVSVFTLSVFYIKVIRKHVSFNFGDKKSSFTGADVIDKLTQQKELETMQASQIFDSRFDWV